MAAETTAALPPAPRTRRLGRLERPALAGVLVREIINFSSYWRSSTFSSVVQPVIYLLAFGFGFGSLVSTVGGRDYVEFVATGTVATAGLLSSGFPGGFWAGPEDKIPRTLHPAPPPPPPTPGAVPPPAAPASPRPGA